jgi:hypothetical protein
MKKKFLFLFACFLLAGALPAQTNDEETLRKTFTDYFAVVEKKDNAATLNYMYPRVFELAPREMLQSAMDAMYADTTTLINFDNYKLLSLSEPVEKKGVKYVLGGYTFRLWMQMKNGEKEAASDYTVLESLKNAYGEDNVVYNEVNRTFRITCNNYMIAILDPQYSSWKFIERKSSLKALMEKILPKKVIKKFL